MVSVILKIVLGEKIILAKKKEVYFEHPYFLAVLWNHPRSIGENLKKSYFIFFELSPFTD